MAKSAIRLLIVAGARPNFMKVAPIMKEIIRRSVEQVSGESGIRYRLVHTGQHYDARMSELFFDELGIPRPDFNLNVGSGSHANQTASILSRFEPVCESENPDWVLVVGDVNSTLACTLVSAKLGIKVAHVEAGLRSFDRTMPEEVNRVVTDALADLLLTPSADAGENLIAEGVPPSKIKFVGNVMIDSLLANLQRARSSSILKQLGVHKGEFVYVTLHRPSNVDRMESLVPIMRELRSLAERLPVVFPMHPRTCNTSRQFGVALEGVRGLHILDPVGYYDSLCLTENARFVLTDSGGLQEESTFFRTPCLTLRPNTERPVTLTIGSNKLTCAEKLAVDLDAYLRLPGKVGKIPPRWDGQAAPRIVDSIIAESA
jgi:UDP-N-acetylglucosamine 2-epimerase (non-hydrolysing)